MPIRPLNWAAALFLLALTEPAGGQEDPSLSDACLHAVHFVDAAHGWAVGDRGVIWHTDDGGGTWALQSSGTVCGLRSVWFADEKTGWAAGGQSLPYSPATAGLILGTHDGGLSWMPLSWQQLPRLNRIQFLNPQSGWAWGEASEIFPTGLFSSESAGQTWHPSPGGSARGWLGGWFSKADEGILTGSRGAMAVVRNRSVRHLPDGPLGELTVRAASFADPRTAWAVGDAGLILRSDTEGASWTVAAPRLAAAQRALVDWRGVHARNGSVWVVGRSGGQVLHTSDSGATWEAQRTGSPLPLEAVWFHDGERGWAVGALGTILATRDGGRTWRTERRGGERMALLAIHASAESTPLLLHAKLGANLGYLCGDIAMARPGAGELAGCHADPEARLGDAVSLAGGAGAELEWRFPHNPLCLSPGQVLEDWNRRSEGRALRELERRLVVAIRTWRPEVIVTEGTEPAEGSDPAGTLVGQAVAQAFQSASDPASFPEILDALQLEPWSAKKLYVLSEGARPADVEISAHELGLATGKPLGELTAVANSLLSQSYRAVGTGIRLRALASRLPATHGDNSLMAGIALEPGGPARRRLPRPIELTEAERRTAELNRNLLSLVERAAQQPALAQQLNAGLDRSLRELSAEQAGSVLMDMSRIHLAHGHWNEARELLEKLLRDFPHHLASAEAYRWLVQFYASSEARHREGTAGTVRQVLTDPVIRRGPGDGATRQKEPAATPGRSRSGAADQSARVGGAGSDVPWSKGAVEVAARLAQASPLAWSDPAIQFPLAAAHRQLGNTKHAEQFYTVFGLNREASPWSDAARAERWIRERQGQPPKPVLLSTRTATPPRLDGRLEDPTWKQASATAIPDLEGGGESGWESQLRVAHDGQFLYIALRCGSPVGESVRPLRPRPRDSELSQQDHVDLYLDLDRDYATYYHLAIDQRGAVFEDCWGDRTWDPTWFVASHNGDRAYTIEAAIPLAELTGTPVENGTVWAFNAVRVVPGQRVMAWSRPAGVQPRPEGFGYLLFRDAGRAAPLTN